MELVIKPFHALPCCLEIFTINKKSAEQDDFGDMYDHYIESAEPYACADMYFESKSPTKEVLDKYNITEEEYQEVISLDKRLNELKGVYHILDNKDTHISYYRNGYCGHHGQLCDLNDLSPIKDILAKYENIIRLEVKGEMEAIKKQISEI